jgi:hypothetical protein
MDQHSPCRNRLNAESTSSITRINRLVEFRPNQHGSISGIVDNNQQYLPHTLGKSCWTGYNPQMDIFTLIVGTLLVVAIAYVILRLAVVIAFNVKTGILYRRNLARKFNDLRLSRMLAALGIDINRYLHNERVIDITEQMNRCVACENTQTCDEDMLKGKVEVEHINYCNNEQTLKEMVDANKSAEASS